MGIATDKLQHQDDEFVQVSLREMMIFLWMDMAWLVKDDYMAVPFAILE
ncbi:hypothetical protein [[Phormidium] sp. ETS-05]|nr:hypothetical protein [[Phormidium] sp. ETS-05]